MNYRTLLLIFTIACSTPRESSIATQPEVADSLPNNTDMQYIIPAEIPSNILDSLQQRQYSLEMIQRAYRSHDSSYYDIEVQKSLQPNQSYWFRADGKIIREPQ